MSNECYKSSVGRWWWLWGWWWLLWWYWRWLLQNVYIIVLSIQSFVITTHNSFKHVFFSNSFLQIMTTWTVVSVKRYWFVCVQNKKRTFVLEKDLLKQLERTILVLMIFQQFSIYQKLFVATHIQTHTLFSKPVYSNMLRLGTTNFYSFAQSHHFGYVGCRTVSNLINMCCSNFFK